MLRLKKLQAIIETLLWLAVVIAMICIWLPVCAVLSLAGMALKIFHVNFVSEIAGRAMRMVIVFVKFVTRRIKMRTDELEAMRIKCSTVN